MRGDSCGSAVLVNALKKLMVPAAVAAVVGVGAAGPGTASAAPAGRVQCARLSPGSWYHGRSWLNRAGEITASGMGCPEARHLIGELLNQPLSEPLESSMLTYWLPVQRWTVHAAGGDVWLTRGQAWVWTTLRGVSPTINPAGNPIPPAPAPRPTPVTMTFWQFVNYVFQVHGFARPIGTCATDALELEVRGVEGFNESEAHIKLDWQYGTFWSDPAVRYAMAVCGGA